MAVFKSNVQVHDDANQSIGEGMAYVHLPRGLDADHDAIGTVSLRRWEPAGSDPTGLILSDGRRLAISLTRSALSDCSHKHILRFQTTWPPTET
jgi:hypothetical protein